MCVICYTNDQNVSNDDLELMWEANPMGAGYAWIEHGEVYYSKGFMTLDELIENLPENRQHLMIHFRISTGGKVDDIHCHPYDIEKVMSVEGKTSKIIFHNGYFDVDWDVSKDDEKLHCDTFLLSRDILPQIKNKQLYDALLSNLNGSKFALFDGSIDQESWFLYGKWAEYKGMKVSNLNFSMPIYPIQKFSGFEGVQDYRSNPFDGYEDDWDFKTVIDSDLAPNINDDIEYNAFEEYMCIVCGEELDKSNYMYGICDECSVENGTFCLDCEKRLGEEFLNGVYYCNDCK